MTVERVQPVLAPEHLPAVAQQVEGYPEHAGGNGVLGAVLALLAGLTTRALVTPTADPKAADGTPLVPADTTGGTRRIDPSEFGGDPTV